MAVLAGRDAVAYPGQTACVDERLRGAREVADRGQLGCVRARQRVQLFVGLVLEGLAIVASPVPVEIDIRFVLPSPPRHAPRVDPVNEQHADVGRQRDGPPREGIGL
jgi:hypothetical protein